MKTNNKKWQSLAEAVQLQNEDPYIKCLLSMMRLSHLMDRYINAKLGVYGLNRTQIRIIIFMASRSKPMTPTELSKLALLTIDTINKSVDNLDKMGLTRSYRSRKDRRVRKVTLTEKGLEIIEKHLPLRREVFSQIMGCFSKDEITTVYDHLQRLLDQIDHLMQQE